LIYAVGIAIALIGVLAVALYGISSERTSADPEPAPQPDAARVRDERPAVTPELPPHDLSNELHARLGTVGEQLDALVAQSAALRKRVETLERELARRPAAGAAAAPAPAPAPTPSARAVPADLEPLYVRLSTIETSLEREGADRLKSQEDVLARVYKLESSRGDGEAARLAAQKAAEERVYKLEQRLHDAETQQVEAERRLAARIEKLEGR
jgi:hypothetical protein